MLTSENTKSFEETQQQLEATSKLLSDVIAAIEAENTNQYESLSAQIDVTNKNLSSVISLLSAKNDAQYQSIINTLSQQNLSLQNSIDANFNKLNTTLKEDVDGINTHLDTVQSDINSARTEIKDLLARIDAKQTEDLQTKFEAIQAHLNDITSHFNDTLSEIEGLITSLSEQNAQEYSETIKKLTGVKNDLTTLNSQMSEDLNNQLTNMQADYTQQIGSLQENVTVSFNEMNSQIETNNTNLNTKIDANNEAMTQSINNQTSTLQQQIANTETNITNTMNSNDAALSDKIDALNKKVDDSFTSVANGKTQLASALATKNQYIKDDATFLEISEAIRNIKTTTQLGDLVKPGYSGATVTYTLQHQHVDGNGNIHTNETDYVLSPGGCYTQQSTYSYSVTVPKGSHEECQESCYEYDCDGWNSETNSPKPGGAWCDRICTKTNCHQVTDYKTETRTGTCYRLGCNHTFHDSEGTTNDANTITNTQVIKKVEVELY